MSKIMFLHPDIDPVFLRLGPIEIYWYALAYILGIVFGAYQAKKMIIYYKIPISVDVFDRMINWAILGIVIGGRLGHVIFYEPDYYLCHFLEIIQVWKGGMSFHGGLIGIAISVWLFSYFYNLRFLLLADLISVVCPIGLFLVRIANFINKELYGRFTELPWGVIFPNAGFLPRHPVQFYEAFWEGPVLWFLLFFLYRKASIRNQPGILSSIFLIGYGVGRFVIEFVREPDGYISIFTKGQFLSLVMIIIGVIQMIYLLNLNPYAKNKQNT